ncbi:MAG: substrate-binding periplasmic protein, partial [Pseudomonas sp.]
LEEAARRAGASIRWRFVPFARSLEDLRFGRVDVVPRVLYTAERARYIHFLPSIGAQAKTIRFIVRPGREASLRRYADLRQQVIGAKRGTAYFEPFDHDELIRKQLAVDDDLLARMFRAGRYDAMIVLDQAAIEAEFQRLGFTAYSYADYRHEQWIDNHYGASRRLYQGARKDLYERLARALEEMRVSGEVGRIYRRFGVAAPALEPQ